jgi:ATP-dependent DNA helicase RecG
MITEEQLRALMHDLESDRVERTASFSDMDKLGIAACAFANDLPNHGQPGFFLVGVDDRGRAVGLQVTDKLLRTLGEVRANGNVLLRELDILLDSQLGARPVAQTALREYTVADYPRFALREFLMNAVMHRDYEATAPIRFYWFSDRIEVQNPGSLYGEASRENFPRQNAYRNPVIAEAMKTLGFVNRYGSGVERAREALKSNGNPTPEFFFEDTYFLVTARARP